MSKKAYIGVPTECLTYTHINENNVAEFFTITSSNTAETGFGWNDDIFITAGGDISNIARAMMHLEITTTLSAIVNINNLTLNWNSLTDSSLNDIFRIKIIHIDNTETIYVESNGEESDILTFSLLAGEKIELYVFRNVKSSMTNRYSAIFNLRIPNGSEIKEVAHNVSNIYIGVPTEVPIYVGNSDDVSLTSENIETYFDVTFEGEGNTFQWIDDALVSDFENPVEPSTYSDIQTFAIRVQYSRLRLIAKKQIQFAFNVDFDNELSTFLVEPEEGPLEIYVNDAEPIVIESNQSLSYTLNEGDNIIIVHHLYGKPYVSLSNLNILGDKEIIGTQIESRAHKVIKAYVGVNGIAQQWYSIPTYLIDFEYINNYNNTYTLTAWKETLNGEPSTELIVPDDNTIIL